MLQLIRPFLKQHIDCAGSEIIINAILVVGILAVSVAVYHLAKLLLTFLEKAIRRSPTQWDDDLINSSFLRAISQLAPAISVRWLIPGLFGESAGSVHWLSALTSLYIVWAVVRIFVIFTGNLYTAFLHREKLRSYAVKGVFQMVKLIFIGIGVIVGLSILIGKTPVTILTALGASAAVLMLVFQDTILGLVASVQLTANKMLERGDWIESTANNLDGEALEVSLTSVKVRNWDNSVSTIPPYSLIKGSFRNYQAMVRSGSRRVKRPLYININTVRFCTPEELEKLEKLGWLEGMEVDKASRVVNLQLLRNYLTAYLGQHPSVNHKMNYMVRQLDHTPSGLPIELYFYISDTRWKVFENLAADIFDHIYAVVPVFGLEIFQTPAGTDFSRTPRA